MIFEFCDHATDCACHRLTASSATGDAAIPPARGLAPETTIVPAMGPRYREAATPFRIDVHHHLVPPEYIQRVHPRAKLQAPLLNWTPQVSLDDMDEAGVATSILSLTTPGVDFGNEAESRDLARACNEYAAGLMRTYPKRFGLFATMPLPHIDATLEEIAYALDVLGADGVGLFTSYGNNWLGAPEFAPVFEELNRRRAIVYVHPDAAACCKNLVPFVTDATIEYGTDTTRTIANLIFSGASQRYPDVRMIFSHAGGTMPFLIERFSLLQRYPHIAPNVPNGALAELRRFNYDIAQAANPVALGALTQIVPVSQVLFGTDVPYRTCVDTVTGLMGSGFAEHELRMIDRDNAIRLLPKYA
jgi:predicted TIM-barrel fold metal-dependent hydrolase